LHEINDSDQYTRDEFANLMVNAVEDDQFLWQVTFTEETTIHMNGHTIRHKCHVWGQEQLQKFMSLCKTP